MIKNTVYKIIDEKDIVEFNKLEKAYHEMASLQALLTSVIIGNPKVAKEQEYYLEQYMIKYGIFDKQKNHFQNTILKPVYIDNFDWEADFPQKQVLIKIYE